MAKRKTAQQTGDSRNAIRIGLDPETNLLINAACDRYMTKKGPFVGSLLKWFVAAPESVQQIIMGNVPADMMPAYLDRVMEFFAGLLGAKSSTAGRIGSPGDSKLQIAAKTMGKSPPEK